MAVRPERCKNWKQCVNSYLEQLEDIISDEKQYTKLTPRLIELYALGDDLRDCSNIDLNFLASGLIEALIQDQELYTVTFCKYDEDLNVVRSDGAIALTMDGMMLVPGSKLSYYEEFGGGFSSLTPAIYPE